MLAKFFCACFLIVSLSGIVAVQAQEIVLGEHVDAQLISETDNVFSGQELWLALRLDHQEHWHTYWKNPGDAGKPTEISWTLPEGVKAGEVVWPAPQRIELPADLVDFGYEGEVFLLIPLTIAESYRLDSLLIQANVNWLECDDVCIPGGAELSLSLPVSESKQAIINDAWQADFIRTRGALPRDDVALDAMFSTGNGQLNLVIQATDSIFENAQTLSFIPDQHRVLDYLAEQKITFQLSSLQLSQSHHARMKSSDTLGGILLVTDISGQQVVYQINAQLEAVDATVLDGVMPADTAQMSLIMIFIFAMTGGIILNLMPCVFPVLSLKVMSLVASRDASLKEQRLHGVIYATGVIVAFLVLAAVLLSLQAGGALIGWGFHLQSPWFVSVLIYLFFIMGLSMSGVVEFGTGIMGAGSELADKDGYLGSFFTGVLASVVASPCTAPFMGAALGFAFTQTMPVALTVFVALGFGMALPLLLFSFIPALARLMPKPGKWMLTFKHILALPLYATAVWLLWVLSKEVNTQGVLLVLGSCLLLSFAAWRYQARSRVRGLRVYLNTFLIVLCLVFSIGALVSPDLQRSGGVPDITLEDGYEAYSARRLAELRAAGTPVFVNMTAAWCITCLVNEKVALSSAVVRNAMIANGVVYLKGDWTNNDPEITAVLKSYKTSGVPLYLMFPANSSKPAEVLPQILTESIVLEALLKSKS